MKTKIVEEMMARRSIRAFKSIPVAEELIVQLLEAARWAPSAGNCQARDIIVVRDAEARRRLSEAALGQLFVWEAPINLVVCANQERSARRYGDRGRTLYSVLDAAAAVENILLAAHSLGLGACWVGAFDAEKVSLALKLPKALRPVAIIPVGYPAEYPIPTPRMGLEEFVHIDFYGSSYRRR